MKLRGIRNLILPPQVLKTPYLPVHKLIQYYQVSGPITSILMTSLLEFFEEKN